LPSEDGNVRVLDQQAATERAEGHAQTIIQATKVTTGPTPTDAGPMPYGPDEGVEILPDGTYDPFQIVVIGGIGDVPADQLEPAIQRVGDALRRSGWVLGDLTPAVIGRDSTRLTGANLADGHTFIIEALHDLNRLVINVTSPPYRHPA
jgi:hypothetical protein